MFLRRSSSLRLVRPSPRANSERRDLETLGTSLFGDAIGREIAEGKGGKKRDWVFTGERVRGVMVEDWWW